ncbi:mitochondrial intermembrane space protein Mia40 [Akanthomyces lecanii RCEF 1005]|uniref:Mitochondrial intermembrane space import and assembly protein 40 n=1 Tax=Akanthomyces lecanii RCEF 1005 TaxID=1081108 RepID=A0A168JQI1_CORDF|nr:mitochondrial intermembrane space protein Mia40 [Akanthomyces lecanii RCEF 1005]
MYRSVLRSASRPAVASLRAQALRSAPRRFASTSPADKSRSWKGSAVRWALAGGAVYYYSTSSVFAEEAIPAKKFSTAPSAFPETVESTQLPTVESIVEERKSQATAKAQKAAEATSDKQGSKEETAAETTTAVGSPAALEEEADQQGAFNPETGEINWDCPCLGGMADGPCGEEFKTAFSCFVYSNEEPKGMECIDKFQGMQECFRKYPEIYGAELAEADDAEDFPGDLEQPSETQISRDDHKVAEVQTPHEDDKAADRQTPRAESKAADTAAAPEQKSKKSTEPKPAEPKPAEPKPAEPKPSPASVAILEQTSEKPAGPETTRDGDDAAAGIPAASIDTTSPTVASHGPKWEDATDANKATPKAKEA